jgi:hypothetical protein
MADYSLGRESNSARQWAELDAQPTGTPGPYVLAQVAAWLGHDERALELLETWVSRHDLRLSFQVHHVDPVFNRLHDTRGWARLLERIGRSPEQVSAVEFDVTRFLEIDE